jgi:hypothetical protein
MFAYECYLVVGTVFPELASVHATKFPIFTSQKTISVITLS